MNSHLILPASMVKPFILHLLHRTKLESNFKLWIYGEGQGDISQDLRDYQELHEILSDLMGSEVMKGISEVSQLNIPSENEVRTPGIGTLLARADKIVLNQLVDNIQPDDEVVIVTTSQLGFALALSFKFHNIIRKSPRVISTVNYNDNTSLANLNLLYHEYNGIIRIDLIYRGKATVILAVSRAIEAIEPPDEPNGIYITKLKDTVFYHKDTDLPTPVTAISMRTLIQLRYNLSTAKLDSKFLKKSKAEKSFPHFPVLKKLEKILDNLASYLNDIRYDVKSEFCEVNMKSDLQKLPSQPDGCSAGYYCKEALKHVLNCSFAITDIVNEGKGATEVPVQEPDLNAVQFKDCINPFLIAGATLDAFREPNSQNAPLRSRCLDMWELFMKEKLPNSIKIECIRPDDRNDDVQIFRTLPFSEVLVSQKALYRIVSSEDCFVITTPFTGFAVDGNIFSGDVRELSERDKKLKQFIFDYVMTVPGFADDFKKYVSNNCCTDDLDFRDFDFYSRYPRLGKRIPIY